MEQPLAPGPAPCGGGDSVFMGVFSFKTYMMIWFAFVGIQELFGWGLFVIAVGTFGIFLVYNKFKVPPASAEVVSGFFGSDFRPVSSSNSFSTVRSRLNVPTSQQDLGERAHSLTIIGHRGAGLDAPENSLSAFRQCKARGCTAVEFDVSMTKDNVPVVFHDDNLMRIVGVDREISDMTWDEVRQVDISVLHPLGEKFRGEKIPSFEEAVSTCLNLGLKFFIDLKDSDERIVQAVLETFKRYPAMYNVAAVSSFSAKVVYLIRRQDPNIIGCMAWRPCYHRYRTWNGNWENLELSNSSYVLNLRDMVWDCFDEIAMNNLYWWFLGISAYLLHKDCITKEASYRWVNKGVRLYLWTVNSPLEKLHIVQNIQLGYLTDTLDAGDLTSSSTMPNYTTLSVNKLRSNPSSTQTGLDNANLNTSS